MSNTSNRIAQSGITNRTVTTYETVSGVVWRVTTATRLTATSAKVVRVTKECQTGLSDVCRGEIVTIDASGRETVVRKVFDLETGLMTETVRTGSATPTVSKSRFGLTFDKTTLDEHAVHAYDAFGRRTETAVTHAGTEEEIRSESYSCDLSGNVTTNAAGRGVSVSLAYDGSYVTNTVYTLPNGNCFSARLSREAGRRNLVTRRDYFFGGQSIYWYSTEYDLLIRPTNATDSVSLVREWLYNRRSELAAATVGTGNYGYAYDSIGNRLWSAANAVTNSYTANSLNQYTAVSSGANPVYDADGNMTGDGTFAYAYDAENRLVSVTSAAETNGAIRVLNAYDHRNRRIRKTVQRLNSSIAPPPSPPVGMHEWETQETHTFVWDGNNIVLEKVEFANGTTRTFGD